MTHYRTDIVDKGRKGLSFWASTILVGLLVVTTAVAAMGLWIVFSPQEPSFWNGATDVLRSVRLLGSCRG